MRAKTLLLGTAGLLGITYLAILPSCASYHDTCDGFYPCDGVSDEAGTTIDGNVSPVDSAGSDANWTCCPLDGSASSEGSADGNGPPGDSSSVDDAADSSTSVDANPSCGDSGSYCGPSSGCVDTSTSVTNCGTCGKVCTASVTNGAASCTTGSCGVTCYPGYQYCGAQCVSDTDVNHCGGCSHVCAAPSGNGSPVCETDGGCEINCNPNFHLCNGQCLPDSDPPSTTDPCVLSDALAIFVSPNGLDTNPGTMEQPVQTLARGVSLATTKSSHRVVACATAGSFTTALSLSGAGDDFGVQIYGGVTCPATGQWTYIGQKTVVAPTSTGPALSVSGLTKGITIVDFEFDAQPGSSSVAGDSSIGAFFANTTGAALQRVKITAKDGVAGAPGSTFNNASLSANLNGGNASNSAPGAVNKCGCADGSSSTGGQGGGSAAGGGTQTAGAGLPSYAGGGTAGTNGAACGAGGQAATANGVSAAATTADGIGAVQWGTLSSTAWAPTPGAKGSDGQPGQGGGGGGGEQVVGVVVGQGGGGACGGCGGGGGGLGGGGGSSIALLSSSSSVSLSSCQLSPGNGKNGGKGADGAAGVAGGLEGTQFAPGCAGGNGGAGAGGNGGGGGAGGLSLGIGYSVTAPVIDGVTVTDAATNSIVTLQGAGTGGPGGNAGGAAPGGGNAGNAGTKGVDGIAYAVKALP